MRKPTQNDVLKVAEGVLSQMGTLQDMINSLKGETPAPAATPSKTSKGSRGSKASNDSKGSGGRAPSAEQIKIRQAIVKSLKGGSLPFFTIKELAESMNEDRIQVRNAVNYLETVGAVVRYAEKLQDGRGQRELIYVPGDAQSLKAAA